MLTMKGCEMEDRIDFSLLTCSTCFSLITSEMVMIFRAKKCRVGISRASTTRPKVPVPVEGGGACRVPAALCNMPHWWMAVGGRDWLGKQGWHPYQCCSQGLKNQFLTSCERLVLRLLYVFRICLFVCVSVLNTCAIYYVIRYYATAVYSSFWRFAGQATANEGSCVLPR